jgi:hypothetical protein
VLPGTFGVALECGKEAESRRTFLAADGTALLGTARWGAKGVRPTPADAEEDSGALAEPLTGSCRHLPTFRNGAVCMMK